MKTKGYFMKTVLVCLLFHGISACVPAEAKEVFGWLEMVHLYPGPLKIRAKMDTGAKTSSLNVPAHVTFERSGDEWVRFEIVDSKSNKTIRVEEKVLRTTTIKGKKGENEERLVVRMGICIGESYRKIDFNLADRSGFNYQILIGRDDLASHFNVVVDPAGKFTKKPRCKIPGAKR